MVGEETELDVGIEKAKIPASLPSPPFHEWIKPRMNAKVDMVFTW